MAITVAVGTPLLVDASPKSNSIDVGTDPEALVVLVAAGGNNDLEGFFAFTVGGQALSFVRKASIIGRNAYLYELLSPPSMSGSQTFQATGPFGSFGTLYAIPYALKGGGAGILRADDKGDQGAAQQLSLSLGSGVRHGVGLVGLRGDVVGHSPLSGTTEDHDASQTMFGHETSPGTGTRSVGWSGTTPAGIVGAMYVEGDAFVVPGVAGAQAGVDDFEVTQGDPVIFATPFYIAGARAGIPSGFRLVAEGPASVYLGVPGRERPQWTDVPPVPESGPDVPVLVYRRARRPELAQLGALAAEAGISSAGNGDLTSLHVDLAVSGAHDVDRDDGATHDLTLVEDATLTPTHSDPPTGERIDLAAYVRQDGTGGRSLAIAGPVEWAGGAEPEMPQEPNAVLALGFVSLDDAATWFGYVLEPGTTGGITDPDDVRDAGRWELVTEPGSSAPPVFVHSPDGTDFLYHWVTD